MPEQRLVNLHSRQLQPSDSPLSYTRCVTALQRLLVENTSTTAIHKRTKYFCNEVYVQRCYSPDLGCKRCLLDGEQPQGGAVLVCGEQKTENVLKVFFTQASN